MIPLPKQSGATLATRTKHVYSLDISLHMSFNNRSEHRSARVIGLSKAFKLSTPPKQLAFRCHAS